MPDAPQKPPIQRVLVITAHPDDSEFGAGGTIAKLVHEGMHVSYCIVTNGNKGSGDRSMTPERLARIREEEQRNAARVLGVETVDFLGFPDCEVEDTRESRLAVTAAIRRHRPDRLIIQNPHRTKNLGA
jgi:LmbE family N-acetylglucosaminyl deacetylase